MASIRAPGQQTPLPTVSSVPSAEKLNMVLTTEKKTFNGHRSIFEEYLMKDMDGAEKQCIDN